MAKEKDANKTAEQPQVDPKAMVDELVAKAKAALDEYMKLDQSKLTKHQGYGSCWSFCSDGAC